ncbi:ISlin1 transposase [Leptospira interrogans serovar Hardjo str. Norma]|uniref:Transposase, IS116/IS110/IS902 family n=38 Tax=Leptospira interrogans TaxID=173 RepID=A0A829D9Q2_LEPIR|nr:ISlin1 transposase [Leptospira interrogans serovar Hardjo str. Norma]EMY03442.1 transposase, IS116/IS110/IS902 family [Leptospira interrogans str. 2002000626]EMY04176.1 transposase, IS116/IS110/IS902 family [Leptospira interrogans str. 2002000626]EMY04210.1 transposase, IS116/IS110/IS902 family [Leptospira interrogans str. 2002000626]EMY05539.1 transposase, IS116/IS110/IS902 family [Leptospira interrogans str. 2002000626]
MLVYHNSGLLRPSAPLKTLGERNEKSRNQIRRNRLWKKTLEVIRIGDNSLHQRQQFSTTEIGISKLINWLNPNDVVGLEAGSQSFRIAKSILNKGIQVIVLNPGDLATIYQSLKKTDKEDSLKIARLIQRFPIEELPTVPIPNDEEEDNRRLCTEQENWTRQLTQSKNRLHSLFTQAGLTHITKKHLRTKANREISVALLPSRYQKEAERILKVLDLVEQNLKLIEEEIKEALKKNKAYAQTIMSMPGIGMITSLAIMSYMGNCKRFSSAKQAAYYVGLVPRVDISGDSAYYGRIVNRGCHSIRRVIVQAAWSLVRCQYGGKIKEFYQRLYPKKGAKKSIIATSRKMIEILYTMIKTGELFDSMPEKVLNRKLTQYGLM